MIERGSCYHGRRVGCPDANLIAAFVGGTLDRTHAEELAVHIDGCTACDELVRWSMRAAMSTASSSASTVAATVAGPARQPPGSVFGRYILLELVGAGGMGVVYAAFDPRLDRKVALKLLWDDDDAARAELEREARLAARLQHPNVIAIYDVGAVDERIYLAMEYVDGVTLADWMSGAARPIREILGMFLQAARGLAAAHGAGLVHRDFKPSNVLVGNDGRVRVLDFGLARKADDAPDRAGHTRSAASGAGTGGRVGSPAYMAPEQHRGEPAGPAADQFAFCVALHEALYGTRPFAGSSLDELAANVLAGRVIDPPRNARVPPWLRRVVLRGLSVDSQARFPSIEAMVAAFGRDPTRARRTWIALAGVVGVAAVALAGHARTVQQRAAACEVHEHQVLGLVGPGPAQQIRAAFAATEASNAADSAERSVAALDRYARTLGGRYRETCDAGGPELARRTGCYDERAAELGELVRAFATADRLLVATAIDAIGKLGPVAMCDEVQASARPDGATPELGLRVARARALWYAGRVAAAIDSATSTIAAARAQGDQRHELDAQLLLGDLQFQLDRPEAAIAWSRAIELGEALGRDADVELGLESLAFDAALRLHDFGEAHQLQRLAAAKVARTGAAATRAGHVASLEGAILAQEGHPDEAETVLRQALAALEKLYGDASPALTSTLGRLAGVLSDQGRAAEMLAIEQRAAVIRERAYGPDHPKLVAAFTNLGAALLDLGRYDEAIPLLRRADDIAVRVLGADSSQRVYVLYNLGIIERRQGNFAAAQATFETALAIAETALGNSSLQVGEMLTGLGQVSLARGRPAEGAARFARALPIVEQALGKEHRDVATVLLGLGQSYLDLQQTARAAPLLERALRLRTDGSEVAAEYTFSLARALWELGRERPRALALARQAAATGVQITESVTQEQIAAWLAAHPAP
jgi:eukaryotic-like serine/threonine-protein kinase